MNKSHAHTTKILDGLTSLGRSCVNADSLTVDGGALPGTIALDARAGTVSWTDQGNLGDPGPYTFEFEYFDLAEVAVTADKSQIAADGVEQVTLTVQCEDRAETTVTLAVYRDGEKIGTFDVSVASGEGGAAKTIAVSGMYEYRVDGNTLDATWQLARFADIGAATVEAV